MTVAAELAQSNAQIEFVLCIEGLGWPVNEADLSSGFAGDIFATGDMYGTMSTVTGAATIHTGLILENDIEDRLDVVRGSYQQGGINARIVDYDGFMLANFTPNKIGTTTTLSATLTYDSTEPYLADGSSFANGDVAWVANSEAILLAGKTLVGGTEYKYTGSTRGYLGTTRGRRSGSPLDGSAFCFINGTGVYDVHKWWRNALVQLFIYQPSSGTGSISRIWSGKLRDMKSTFTGTEYTLQAVADYVYDLSRTRKQYDLLAYSMEADATFNNSSDEDQLLTLAAYQGRDQGAVGDFYGNRRRINFTAPGLLSAERESKYVLPAAYHYRTEPGGTRAMITVWDNSSLSYVQAADVGSDVEVIMEFVRVGEEIYLALKRAVDSDGGRGIERTEIWTENLSRLGGGGRTQADFKMVTLFESGTPCRFLLSNWLDSSSFNRYTVNKQVTRNPIDILLCHLTSRDDEYFIDDSIIGTTTSTIAFTNTVSTDTNAMAGAALFCVEGTDKGESRVITSNTTTTVTVENPFTTGETAKEFQVRNSIYDVLPLGWGIGVPYWRIDVESFEAIRDKYMPDVNVGKYMLGLDDKMDIFEFLRREILEPFGIFLFIDRTTGKLTAEYIGEAIGDGIIDTYTTLTDDDIIETSGIQYSIKEPVRSITYKIRSSKQVVIGWEPKPTIVNGVRFTGNTEVYDAAPAALSEAKQSVTVGLDEIGISLPDDDGQTVEISAALMTTDEDISFLITRAQALLKAYASPPPTMDMLLAPKHITTLRPNSFVVFTWATAPANPFTGTSGWTNVVGRIISSTVQLRPGVKPGLRVKVELLTELGGGLIAPAAKLAGAKSGSDGTSHWYEVSPSTYTADGVTVKDYYGFAVGDRLQVRQQSGAYNTTATTTVYTIRSFGANDVADPTQASSDIIRITTAAVGAANLATTDYLTFATWSASNTARMDTYAAYADANETLAVADPAINYL